MLVHELYYSLNNKQLDYAYSIKNLDHLNQSRYLTFTDNCAKIGMLLFKKTQKLCFIFCCQYILGV